MSTVDRDNFDTYTDYIKEYLEQMGSDWDRPVKPGGDASASEIQWYMEAVDAWYTFRGAEKIGENLKEQNE